jgi:hypothetical protein
MTTKLGTGGCSYFEVSRFSDMDRRPLEWAELRTINEEEKQCIKS